MFETRRRIAAAALLLGLATTSPARAQSQLDLDQAAGAKFSAADKALNLAYDKLLDKISPAGQKALIAAQRLWVHFRDAECAFETMGSLGGSVYPMAVTVCRTRLTRVRLADIDAQINCGEGDMTCGAQ